MAISTMTRNLVEGKSKLMSTRQVAEALKVSMSTMNRWIKIEYFPKPDYLIGRCRKWSSETVADWVKHQLCN